jgi:hypothetical protein
MLSGVRPTAAEVLSPYPRTAGVIFIVAGLVGAAVALIARPVRRVGAIALIWAIVTTAVVWYGSPDDPAPPLKAVIVLSPSFVAVAWLALRWVGMTHPAIRGLVAAALFLLVLLIAVLIAVPYGFITT